VGVLKEKNKREILASSELGLKLKDVEVNIQYMSNTINDFMTFYRPNKEKENFSVCEAVRHGVEIISASVDPKILDIRFEQKDEIYVHGFINEYTQVVVSLLTNAKDLLKNKAISGAFIEIKILENEKSVVLEIRDNAGGIKEENLHKVFEPYFTTKHKSMGTGLGLYISKMIIENSMNGKLSVENVNSGVKFSIEMEKINGQ
jgi:signal transduction histidine kinase